jgi:Protein of unknown function (DUF3800)
MYGRLDPDSLSDFVIYVDESGDHGLNNIDPEYPLFVLAFVIMRREDYVAKITPDLLRLKFNYWGHDQIVFHERDIRKKVGSFAILADKGTQSDFMNDLTHLIKEAPFHICVTIIDKKKLAKKYTDPWNPYHVALGACMERLRNFFVRQDQKNKLAHVVFESRGKNEDNELELEFRRITNNNASWGYRKVDFTYARFEPVFAKKDANAAGLQLADLIARPCGLKYLRPDQVNRTHDVLADKMLKAINGWKVFP